MRRAGELERRRLALREQIAAERQLLAGQVHGIEQQFAGVDRAVAGVRSFLHSPAMLVLGVAALVLIGPKRVLRVASRSVVLLTAARRVFGLVR